MQSSILTRSKTTHNVGIQNVNPKLRKGVSSPSLLPASSSPSSPSAHRQASKQKPANKPYEKSEFATDSNTNTLSTFEELHKFETECHAKDKKGITEFISKNYRITPYPQKEALGKYKAMRCKGPCSAGAKWMQIKESQVRQTAINLHSSEIGQYLYDNVVDVNVSHVLTKDFDSCNIAPNSTVRYQNRYFVHKSELVMDLWQKLLSCQQFIHKNCSQCHQPDLEKAYRIHIYLDIF